MPSIQRHDLHNLTKLLSLDPNVESVDDVELSMAALGGTGCTSCNGGGCVACVNEFRAIVLPNNAENTDTSLSNLLSSEDLWAQKDLLAKTAKHHGMLSGLHVGYHASSAGYYPILVTDKWSPGSWRHYVFFLEEDENFEGVYNTMATFVHKTHPIVEVSDLRIIYEDNVEGSLLVRRTDTPTTCSFLSHAFTELIVQHDEEDALADRKKRREEEEKKEKKRREEEEKKEKKRRGFFRSASSRKKGRHDQETTEAKAHKKAGEKK